VCPSVRPCVYVWERVRESSQAAGRKGTAFATTLNMLCLDSWGGNGA
jgi:hypothetical protein